MLVLGTGVILVFSRALGTSGLRDLTILSLRAITASTTFGDSTERMLSPDVPKASTFNV